MPQEESAPFNRSPLTETQDEQLRNWFMYHPASADDQARYNAVNDAARNLARVIMESCPKCADQSAALRQVREAKATANYSIACKGV